MPQVKNSDIWHKDTNNFAPRIGFAWDTLGNQKWVVRGGFGIFYDRLYNNVFENIRFNPPFYADETSGNFITVSLAVRPLKTAGLVLASVRPAITRSSSVPTLFPAGLPKPVPRHIDQNLVAAYYEQYSFGIQHEISKDFALEANYIGTLGRKLIGILNRNTYDGRLSGELVTTRRPNPLFNSDNARGNFYGSNYNALDLTLRKRFSNWAVVQCELHVREVAGSTQRCVPQQKGPDLGNRCGEHPLRLRPVRLRCAAPHRGQLQLRFAVLQGESLDRRMVAQRHLLLEHGCTDWSV